MLNVDQLKVQIDDKSERNLNTCNLFTSFSKANEGRSPSKGETTDLNHPLNQN